MFGLTLTPTRELAFPIWGQFNALGSRCVVGDSLGRVLLYNPVDGKAVEVPVPAGARGGGGGFALVPARGDPVPLLPGASLTLPLAAGDAFEIREA